MFPDSFSRDPPDRLAWRILLPLLLVRYCMINIGFAKKFCTYHPQWFMTTDCQSEVNENLAELVSYISVYLSFNWDVWSLGNWISSYVRICVEDACLFRNPVCLELITMARKAPPCEVNSEICLLACLLVCLHVQIHYVVNVQHQACDQHASLFKS